MLVMKARDRLWQELARAPTVAEVAALLGRSDEAVLDGLEAASAMRAESLDAPLGNADDDDAVTHTDRLGATDPGYARVDAELAVADMTRILDSRAREVLRLRFQDDLLQSEIAQRVDCSQMHVSRIIRDSLERLRRYADRGRAGPTGQPPPS
jgi:RNA polymerase sigma-B factor